MSVPSDVRWCCRVHPEARIWKFKDNVSHRGEITAADSAPRKCICVSRASTRAAACNILHAAHHFCTDSSFHRWNSREDEDRVGRLLDTLVVRGHRLLVGGFVNIRAIQDTAEISITCLAALILGAATSCRALCSASLTIRIRFDRKPCAKTR